MFLPCSSNILNRPQNLNFPLTLTLHWLMQQCHTTVGHCTGRQQGGAEGVTGGMQDAVGVWVVEQNCLTGPVHQYPNMPGSADNIEGHVAPIVAEGEIALIV